MTSTSSSSSRAELPIIPSSKSILTRPIVNQLRSAILSGPILEYCISFLRVRELLVVSRVNRAWYQACDSRLVWNTHLLHYCYMWPIVNDLATLIPLAPMSQDDWEICKGTKVKKQAKWREYSSKLLLRVLSHHKYWVVRELRGILSYFNFWHPPGPNSLIPSFRTWVTSSILRRHVPIAVELPPTGICQCSPHVTEDLQRRQAAALQQLSQIQSAFGNIHALVIDLDSDDEGRWLSQILSEPSVHRVQYLPVLPPTIWGNSKLMEKLASPLPYLRQIQFGHFACLQCQTSNARCEAMNFAISDESVSSAISTVGAVDLRGFSAVRSVMIDSPLQWNQWKCLADLPDLRCLNVKQHSLVSKARSTIPSQSFASIPLQLGLQNLIKLNLGCYCELRDVSEDSWVRFLQQLPHLQWLRVEGTSYREFLPALSNVAKQLPKLRETRWCASQYEELSDFNKEECVALLTRVSNSFTDMQLRFFISPKYIDFYLDDDTWQQLDDFSDPCIPHVSIEKDVNEDDEDGFYAMVEDENRQKVY